MSTLCIKNLPRINELDQAARTVVTGGAGAYPMPAIMVGEPAPGGFPNLPAMPKFPHGFPFTPSPPIWHGPIVAPDPDPPKVVPL